MGIKQKTEEELKESIFDTYSQLREESSADRRQVYFGQLCDSVFRWCKDYLFSRPVKKGEEPEANEMGVEIVKTLERIVKEENNTPKEEKSFFNYFVTSLYKARAEYYRNKKGIIILPRIIYDMEKRILLQESNEGKKLSEEEKIECISKYFYKTKEKARKYLEIINNKDVSSLTDDENTEMDIPDSYKEPVSTFFLNFDASENKQKFLEVMESVFASRQEKTRAFYRSLFTAQCLDTSTGVEWLKDNLKEYLDTDILETYEKTGKKPANREIYIKYYPDNNTPDESVSNRLREFRNLLKAAQEEKGLKIFSL